MSTTTTSTEASEKSIVAAIRENRWWQGSVVRADDLRKLEPDLPEGPTHWVVASQTCNLYNPSLDRVGRIEWVGARVVEGTEAGQRGGRHPRLLEVMTSGGEDEQWIQCDSQERHWGTRALLAQIEPCSALRNSANAGQSQRFKDIFATWLARGYTRLELSDELNAALKGGKFEAAVKKLVESHGDDIFGVFIRLDSEDECSPEDVRPPCDLELIVVVSDERNRDSVRTKLESLLDAPHGKDNTSRTQALKLDHGVRIAHSVTVTTRWTAADIETSIRFSFPDYLSGPNQDGADS